MRKYECFGSIPNNFFLSEIDISIRLAIFLSILKITISCNRLSKLVLKEILNCSIRTQYAN